MFIDDLVAQIAPEGEIIGRLPRPIDADETARLRLLIEDAVRALAVEFDDVGRNLVTELAVDLGNPVQPLHYKVRWAVREMVSAAILIGPSTGMRTVSSSTGAQSDSATFADVESSSWSGISITDRVRRRLGLPIGNRPRGRFPRPPRWPEVMLDDRSDY